jgi:long-chain acyl-CoA synthetase
MIDFTRTFDIPEYQQNKYPQARAVNYFVDGKWQSVSIQTINSNSEIVACWLLEKGFMRGDRIAVLPKMGSAEWLIFDFACQQLGLITVPIHPTASVEDIQFILAETEAKMCVFTEHSHYEKTLPAIEKSAAYLNVYHLEQHKYGYFSPLTLTACNADSLTQVRRIKSEIKPDDTLVILYTSGTSGTPKGVMLSHHNVVSSIKSILTILPLAPSQRVLSFLPFSHVFERTAAYAYLAFGAEIYFSQSLERLNHDFKSVKPFLCTSVPKTLEKMVDILEKKLLEKNRLKRTVISWAMRVGEKYREKRKQDFLYPFKLFFARLFVLRTFRTALGGKIKYMAVGAAALQPKIGRLFTAAGIITLPGYGMTETSPFISVNRPEPGLNRFGTVGIPVPGVSVKIDNPNEKGEGEILVKGPNVMQGYYKRPELTNEIISKEGWLHTGDIGRFEYKRFLVITDRKKDIFKTSAGKYIAPQPLENLFTSSPFIAQCLILGFNRPHVSAILVPNFSLLQSWCEDQGIHWTAPSYMVHNIKVIKKIQDEVDTLNASLQGYERVVKFILSEEEWTVENKDLTTSFKPKRNRLLEKHAKDIEKIYR